MAEHMSGQVANIPGEQRISRWKTAEAAQRNLDLRLGKLDPDRITGRAERLELLSRIMEFQVIPRLVTALEANDMPIGSTVNPDGQVPDSREVIELGALVLANDIDAAFSFVEGIMNQGVSPEALYLDLLAPAARRLGRMWVDDECDFTQVTTGVWRLQRMMHEVSPAFQSQVERSAHGRWALLTLVPGEQHGFGLAMVAEFFRREGWNVHSGPIPTMADLSRAVRADWYAVAGLSAGSDSHLDAVASCIRTIRGASCNPAIKILVGGPLFLGRPELAARVGADGCAQDAQEAVRQADAMVASQAPPRG